MNEIVSIITPVYNSEKYLKDTIESVIMQDYENWELIIIDDSSTDNSRAIVKSYMLKDERIHLILLSENSGVANARNVGMKASRGRYIAFLDSDDLWYPDKLSQQVTFMKTHNYYFTYSNYDLINDQGNKLNKEIKAPLHLDYKDLLRGNPIGCLTVMIDCENIKSIEMPTIRHEDYATWLNIVKNGVEAFGINKSLALYRKANNSLSSNKFKAIKWTWNIYRKNQQLNLLNSLTCLGMYMVNILLKYVKA